MAKEVASDNLMEDELIAINLTQLFNEDDHDHEQILAIPDANYAEELQFQETLMASLLTSPADEYQNQSLVFLSLSLIIISSGSIIIIFTTINKHKQEAEIEESSSLEYSLCEICAEKKLPEQMFIKYKRCAYSFCSDCIGKHIATKVEDQRILKVVSCPGPDCVDLHALELEACHEILPKEVVERWDEALCEWLLLGSRKFYCPFRDCSAMLLINDGEEEEEGEAVRESECPMCHRLFCALCYVPWHSGVDCEEFQRLNEDERGREDLMVKELVKEKKWRRCPHCKFYVEKMEGCLHITCRCNFEFCYGCGSEWTRTHGADCQRD
ncbi:hypothetical protein FNV43_RR02344 [Rhamnella rubrinervis]|uniref:RBR-type E3 ubiquitin transferase n=1 Tax=Rhamnella rubrinervis TaxID=2594499 RepID=A0A8K0MSW3_9ROSA|nr:hypothetical protein FNV43_RR02344 [Rhamnella rubrinervis]